MLMHEWIRYRDEKLKRSAEDDEAPEEGAAEAEGEAAGADVETKETGVETEETEAAPAEAEPARQPEVAEETEAQEPSEEPQPQAEPEQAKSTDREREEVLASLQEELDRAGQSMQERLEQIQARQRQLPIEVEEPEPEEDEERGKRPSETRQELVKRLLDPVLTLREAALLLEVCPTTVRRYTNRGLLNCFRTPGNQRRFHLSDVLEFMERREHDEV
ncbi:MAG: MerR family transcriptional regulator [Armatimonadota bacterium]